MKPYTSIFAASALFSLVGCAVPVEGVDDSEPSEVVQAAEGVGRRIYLTPVDARARVGCREEDNRYYCSKSAADAARAKCAAKVLKVTGSPCIGDACVRARVTNEPCTVDGETYPTTASCKTPRPENCSYYSACLEAQRPCGERGYGLGYGEKYCNAFANNAAFSAAGIAWVNSTMLCLQQHLASIAANQLSCDALTDDAFASHPACYTRPGASICDLGPSDALQVLNTISATDLLSSRALKQEASVVRTCVVQIFGRLLGSRTTSLTDPGFAPLSAGQREQLLEQYDFWTKLDAELAAR